MVSFLVVDDDPVTRRMLTDLLETKGEVINELESGNQALDFFASGKKADICWIDLLMPDISGIEVCGNICISSTLREPTWTWFHLEIPL